MTRAPACSQAFDDALAHAAGPARDDHPTSAEVRERNLGPILVMHTGHIICNYR